MDTQHLGVLRLIRSALTGAGETLPEGFDLAGAYPLIGRHQVAPLIYEGARLSGLDTAAPVMRRLFHDYCVQTLRNERQMQAVEELRTAFDRAGIEYLFFKGVVLKARYPKPEMRVMGDADVLIRTAQYPAVDELLRAQGYELKGETPQEWQYVSRDLMIEPHKILVDPEDVRDFAVFGDSWALTAPDGEGRPCLPPEVELAHLVSHLAKHFRTGGVGLRQMIDLWILRGDTQAERSALEDLLGRLGLAEFYENVRRVLGVWFENRPEDDITRQITQFIFDSGSFGTERSHVQAISLRKTGGRGMRLHGICSRLFPPLSGLKDQYPVLKRQPMLLPLIWMYRLFHMALRRPGRAAAGLRRITMIRPKEIRQFAGFLQMVGLGEI